MLYTLLLKNISPARIVGFIISNFIGLAIVMGGIIFYNDAGSLWKSDDSFIKNDYMVVNKKVSSAGLWGEGSSSFSSEEVNDIKSQPWVRDVGEFTANDYKVWASVGAGGRGMSTMLFFESVPDRFIDGVEPEDWFFDEASGTVPVILSKDYLTLYNFGFASSQGLPKLSEQLMGSIPLQLTLTSEDETVQKKLNGRIVGFSNRLNTILVPESFMSWSNRALSPNSENGETSRLIIDISSPGDVAITKYLEHHDMEVAGDKSASSAAYLIKVITGIVLAIGSVITLLSFFILLLSISLLMEKSRGKLHSLLKLGYPIKKVAGPYYIIVTFSSLIAFGGAVLCSLLLRGSYLGPLEGLGIHSGSPWVGLMTGGVLTFVIITCNLAAVYKRVISCWRN